LQALLNAIQGGQSLSAVAPWALAIACVAGIQSFVNAVQRERQEILGEVIQRHIEEHVLEVATSVDLLGLETPALHNRVQRMQLSGPQSLNLIFGLSGLISGAVGVAAVLVTLITIEPVLVLMVSIVFVPAWLSATRRGEAFWRFFWRMTPRDRERQYLARLLSDRDAAKEIRAFNLAQFLRSRHRSLYDERIVELRRVAAKQLWHALLANVIIAAVLAATLLVVGWLALSGAVPLSAAGIAVAGVAIVGARLSTAGYAAGTLTESARYVDDYLAFVELLPRHADAFLNSLPNGYETVLGPEFEGGSDLSVGQWQRVALARALFRCAPFVILDEPTAALDPQAEHDLFERIRVLLAGRTVLLISHRFSSVRHADRIYVLHGGRVTEAGTHDELMAREGHYAELFRLQAAAYLAGSPDAL
jgi:ABC-type multidrug transport system fused ATPase/permease subunit